MITENKELERLRSALRDVIDPIGAMQRECPVGHELNHAAVTIGKSLQYVQAKARAALSASPAPSGQGVSGEVERHLSHETVCGFQVAAYRETHPEHGDKYGHTYSEHWSTPNSRDPRVKVERLFTEAQLRSALAAPAPSCAPGEVERHLRDALNDSEQLSDGTVNITAEHAAQLNADVDGWEARTLTIEQAWDELLNVDDRTSPEEYPDMCLITREELADFMERAALSPQGLDAKEGGE